MRPFFPNPLTPSSLNPLPLLLCLSLLISFTASAWDDDDTDSNSFHQSNIQNQESKITRTSVIDFGGPKRLAQEDAYIAPKQLRTQIHQDPIERQNHLLRESTASLQRETERRQENNAIQQAKQDAYYAQMDQEECEMAEFLGGVYKATFGATTGRNSAVTTDGYVYRSGNNFITPKGIYTKSGNTYAGPDSFTTQTGTLFFGNEGTTIQAGGAFFTEGESGYIVSPNCRNTSTWRSRCFPFQLSSAPLNPP
jgi:hypothetical protein